MFLCCWVLRSLYIFKILFPCQIMVCNIFSHLCLVFSSPLRMSLSKQKFLILMKSNLSTFSSMDHAFCIITKNLSLNPKSQRFSTMSSSTRLMVLCFTLKSMIHFELILEQCVKFRLRFIYFPIVYSCFSTICPKASHSFIEWLFYLHQKSVGQFCVVHFWIHSLVWSIN